MTYKIFYNHFIFYTQACFKLLFFICLFLILSGFSEQKVKTSFLFNDAGLKPLDPLQKNKQQNKAIKKNNTTASSRQSSHTNPVIEPKLNQPQNSLSEDFYSKKETNELLNLDFYFDDFFTDISWFFENKNTKHKIGLIPIIQYDKRHKTEIALRFFSYSLNLDGYYMSLMLASNLQAETSQSKQYLQTTYIKKLDNNVITRFIYSNRYEKYFGNSGMDNKLEGVRRIRFHKLLLSQEILHHKIQDKLFFSLQPQFFFKKKYYFKSSKNKDFKTELFVFVKSILSYDSRVDKRNPKKSVFHQAGFYCKSILDYENAYCKAQVDFRFYIPLFQKFKLQHQLQNSLLAFRFFYGQSLFNPSSYFLSYNLAGIDFFNQLQSLRGFETGRFRGDHMYFTQAEVRIPLWDTDNHFVVFLELGEVSKYGKSFQNFVVDYGLGLRMRISSKVPRNLSIDYGIGRDLMNKINQNFTISMSQAF